MGSKDFEHKRKIFAQLKTQLGERAPAVPQRPPASPIFDPKPRRGVGDAARKRMASVPILGTIPAGFGDAAEPADLGSIPVDLQALNIKPSARTFALKVRGDSMTGAQISNGDLVIVEAREPKLGDIVAALIDGETTLKRFVMEDGQLFLRAENPNYPDLIPLRELTVQGVVRAVVRVCDPSRTNF